MTDIDECCGSGCNNCVLDRTTYDVSREADLKNCIFLAKNYRNFKVIDIEPCTDSVYKFVFQFSEEKQKDDTLVIPGGSYLMLRAIKNCDVKRNLIFSNYIAESTTNYQHSLTVKNNERNDKDTEDIYISRPYTPTVVNKIKLEFTVLIKLEPFGAMSGYLQTLNIGDLTEWKGVYSKVDFNPRLYTQIICFCHGVAVTTIYAIAKYLLEIDDLDTEIDVYVGFKDLANILLRDEFVQLNSYWNFKSTIFLSQENSSLLQKRYSETIIIGRINREHVVKLTGRKEQKFDLNETLFLMCGTNTFTTSINNYLNELGYNKIKIL